MLLTGQKPSQSWMAAKSPLGKHREHCRIDYIQTFADGERGAGKDRLSLSCS